MKKSIGILLVALLATGMSLSSQNRRNGAPEGEGVRMGKPRMGVLKELNLTDDQKAKLKVLHQGFVAQDSASKEQFKKQRQAVQEERKLAFSKILTPEQLLQIDKMRVEKQQKMKGKKGQFGPGNRGVGVRQGGFAGHGRGQMMGQPGQMAQSRGQMMGQPGQMAPMSGQMMLKRQRMNPGMQMGNQQHAGPRINPEIRIKNQVEHMTKQLGLTPEQAAQIQAIQMKHAKKEIAAYKKMEKKHTAQLKIRTGKFDEIKA
ncbi:MAG: hypothetical protein NTY32_02630, partial [Bacteroidia bacterium]|nr:hypothetical protein [Bacteroidia bacterium]